MLRVIKNPDDSLISIGVKEEQYFSNIARNYNKRNGARMQEESFLSSNERLLKTISFECTEDDYKRLKVLAAMADNSLRAYVSCILYQLIEESKTNE